MRLIGNPKDQVEKANSQEEAKEIIEKAGMELTDEEMNKVGGGVNPHTPMCARGNKDIG